MCLLFCTGMFGLYTFIAPLLVEVSGLSDSQVPIALLVFGAGATIGILLSGRLADWRLELSIMLIFAAQAAVHLGFVLFGGGAATVYVLMFLLGGVGMAAVAPLKTYVLNAARDAPSLASTLTSSTLNLGVAVGATICAAALAAGVSYARLPWLGVACSLAGLATMLLAGSRQSRIEQGAT
jgi:DHA1 family inner membrane transport protein